MTDRIPTGAEDPEQPQEVGQATRPDVSPLSIQEIGSASRSCLVILVLAVVILLLICLSWLLRLLF